MIRLIYSGPQPQAAQARQGQVVVVAGRSPLDTRWRVWVARPDEAVPVRLRGKRRHLARDLPRLPQRRPPAVDQHRHRRAREDLAEPTPDHQVQSGEF